MKKMLKMIFGIIILLVALVLIAAVTLPLTINPIVKAAASTIGPKVLGVPVSVGNIALSPLAGRLTISELSVGNPQGYSDKPAFAVEKVDVELDIFSLTSDTILVKKIQVDAPAISYEIKEGASNFDTIQANARKSSDEEKTRKPAAVKSGEKKPGKKVIIEVFTLNGAKVSYASTLTLGQAMTLPLAPVTVKDIGKETGGASFADAITLIVNEIVGGLGQAVKAVAGQSAEALKGAAKGSAEAAKGVANAAADTAKGAADTASGAAKSVTSEANDAAKSIKSIFK